MRSHANATLSLTASKDKVERKRLIAEAGTLVSAAGMQKVDEQLSCSTSASPHVVFSSCRKSMSPMWTEPSTEQRELLAYASSTSSTRTRWPRASTRGPPRSLRCIYSAIWSRMICLRAGVVKMG